MKTQIEKFSAIRLTAARQRRGLTKKALSEAVWLSAQAITAFENKTAAPSEETVVRMAFALRFPLGWFYSDESEDLPQESISFRARSRLTATTRSVTLATGWTACNSLSPAFQSYFDFPVLDMPNLSGEEPESAAQILRDYWKLGQGPIKNMVHLLEAKGVEVYWLNSDSECVDAVSFWRDNKPFVLLNQAKPAGERERFDLAHELAHLVLHRQAKVPDERAVELEAHRFASAFLLPAVQFRAECPRQPMLAQFLPLKQRWGVSIQAMVRRCVDLGVLSHWQYETAFKAINAKGWRRSEPHQLPRQESALHMLAFERLTKKGIAPRDFAQQVKIAEEDLFEIVPVSQKFVPDSMPQEQPKEPEIVLKHLQLVS